MIGHDDRQWDALTGLDPWQQATRGHSPFGGFSCMMSTDPVLGAV